MSNCEVKFMGLSRPQYKLLLSKLGRTREFRIKSSERFFFLCTSTLSSNRISAFTQWKQEEAKETIVTHKKKREQKSCKDRTKECSPNDYSTAGWSRERGATVLSEEHRLCGWTP